MIPLLTRPIFTPFRSVITPLRLILARVFPELFLITPLAVMTANRLPKVLGVVFDYTMLVNVDVARINTIVPAISVKFLFFLPIIFMECYMLDMYMILTC